MDTYIKSPDGEIFCIVGRKNHDEPPTLVGVLTHEAHPITYGVGG